jgi:hypothetical protein
MPFRTSPRNAATSLIKAYITKALKIEDIRAIMRGSHELNGPLIEGGSCLDFRLSESKSHGAAAVWCLQLSAFIVSLVTE